MKKIKEMTGNERIAYKNTKHAINWIVGGIENEVTDGYRTEMPTYEELEDMVYEATTTATYGDGFESCRPTKEVKFAGEKFIREVIRHIFDKEGFQYEVKHQEPAPAPEKKQKGTKEYFAVVRNKAFLKNSAFKIMKIEASSKKEVEDILFEMNLAPFRNKIMTREQLINADGAFLEATMMAEEVKEYI